MRIAQRQRKSRNTSTFGPACALTPFEIILKFLNPNNFVATASFLSATSNYTRLSWVCGMPPQSSPSLPCSGCPWAWPGSPAGPRAAAAPSPSAPLPPVSRVWPIYWTTSPTSERERGPRESERTKSGESQASWGRAWRDLLFPCSHSHFDC